jgi:hypothetical protein
MANRFASGKIAIAECDQCGFRYKLKDLKKLVVKTKLINLKVCPQCWVPDQPQLQLGMYPVEDPQALREPRKDLSYYQSGTNVDGYPSEGSRIFQWGWNPVGGSRGFDDPLTPNYLVATTYVGTVTITTS